MSAEQIVFDIWVNPLLFIAVDQPHNDTSASPTAEMIINYLQSPDTRDLESIIQKYKEIAAVSDFLPIVPAETHILGKLVFPLKNAKGCYMIGNYLGTIALCGIVAEMVAILCFDMAHLQLNGKLIDVKTQDNVFGSTFENLGQDRRVKVLLAYGVIEETQRKQYDIIRTIRKKYLHVFAKEHTDIAQDAVKVFAAATSLVANLIKIEFHQGKVSINPLLAQYLIEKGFAIIPPQNSE